MASQEPCMFRMNDGRSFTDYRPRCMVQQNINHMTSKKNSVQNNSYDTRMYLMKNAETMMESNRNHLPCATKACTSTHITPPDKNTVKCDANSCTSTPTGLPGGIGTGRMYSTV